MEKFFFTANIKALEPIDPFLARILKTWHTENHRHIPETARLKSIGLRNGFSLETIQKHCEELLRVTPEKAPRLLITYGTGYGVLLEQLKSNPFHVTTCLVIVEKDIDMIGHLFCEQDLTPLFSQFDLLFISKADHNPSLKFFNYIRMHNRFLLLDTLFPLIFQQMPTPVLTYYLEIAHAIKAGVEQWDFSVGNCSLDSFIGFENIRDNLPLMATAPDISAIKGQFKGVPGIVLSTGPSLQALFPFLEQISDRALMISADASLHPLSRRQFYPHMVATVERLTKTKGFFEGVKPPEPLWLISLPVVYRSSIEAFPGNVCFAYREERLSTWIPFQKEMQAIGPSCSHLAYTALALAGCNPIILIGQDLAFDPDSGESHASGTSVFQSSSKTTYPPEWLVEVEGNSGRPVPSMIWWRLYAQYFESLIDQTDAVCIHAISANKGAKLKGALRMDVQDVVETYLTKTYPIRETLARHLCISAETVTKRQKQSDIKEIETQKALVELVAQSRNHYLLLCQILKSQMMPEDIPESLQSFQVHVETQNRIYIQLLLGIIQPEVLRLKIKMNGVLPSLHQDRRYLRDYLNYVKEWLVLVHNWSVILLESSHGPEWD